MRGTVLLLNRDRTMAVDAELWRASGLMVYGTGELAEAVEHLQRSSPDVIVARLPAEESASAVARLRASADPAVSLIVATAPEERDAVRHAGADSFHDRFTAPEDLLYEIHRALILRRSGRRLPWNG
jgi:DNA-binding NarL/FixJ family response regulator